MIKYVKGASSLKRSAFFTLQSPSRRSAGTRSGPCCAPSCCPPGRPTGSRQTRPSPIKTSFDGRRTSSGATELSERVREANGCAACEDTRQVLHAFNEPFDLPAADHDLVDLLHDGIAFVLGFLIAADQRVITLVVLFLVLHHSGIPGNQVVHRLGVDVKLLVQTPVLLLQLRGITEPGHLSMAVK